MKQPVSMKMLLPCSGKKSNNKKIKNQLSNKLIAPLILTLKMEAAEPPKRLKYYYISHLFPEDGSPIYLLNRACVSVVNWTSIFREKIKLPKNPK
jgi:hypothetical protein